MRAMKTRSGWRLNLLLPALLISWFFNFSAQAEMLGPGWYGISRQPISPAVADEYFSLLEASLPLERRSLDLSSGQPDPEIQELARSLQNDPKLIFEFVHNHIDYVPYFGLLKGATQTSLDGCGNDFDQACLLIALLKQSGYSDAHYVKGTMSIPNIGYGDEYSMCNWLGAAPEAIQAILANGGLNAESVGGSSGFTSLPRVWVEVSIGGRLYRLDPALKHYEEEREPFDIAEAMGYLEGDIESAAGGSWNGEHEIHGLDKDSVAAKLDEYTSNLVATLRSEHPNAEMGEIIPKRAITREELDELPEGLRFVTTGIEEWREGIPDTRIHKVRVHYGNIDEVLNIPDIAGKKLTINHVEGRRAFSVPEREITYLPIGDLSETRDSPTIYYDSDLELYDYSSILMGDVSPYGYNEMHCTFKNYRVWDRHLQLEILDDPHNVFSFVAGSNLVDSRYYLVEPFDTIDIGIRATGAGRSMGKKSGVLQTRTCLAPCNDVSADSRDPRVITDYFPLDCAIMQAPHTGGSYGLHFGHGLLGSYDSGTALLANRGSSTLHITDVTPAGKDSEEFRVISGGGEGNIPSGGYRSIEVKYLANRAGVHSAFVRIIYEYDGFSYKVFLPLMGETIPEQLAKLWLEDSLIASEDQAGGSTLTLEIEQPYLIEGENGEIETVPSSSQYTLDREGLYVIVSDFGGGDAGLLLKKRQKVLDGYLSEGLADTSRKVRSEGLNIIGQTWMHETNLAEKILSVLAGEIRLTHHRFGIVAQENSYYIDIKNQLYSYIRRTGASMDDKPTCLMAGSLIGSALEHGVLEQLQGADRPAVSTAKLLDIAADLGGGGFILVNDGNWEDLKSRLAAVYKNDIGSFETWVFEKDADLIMPSYGYIEAGEWKGKGYISIRQWETQGRKGNTIGMVIGSDHYGGYPYYEGDVDTEVVSEEYASEQKYKAEESHPESPEPVDMVTGAYLFNHTDLSLGAPEPRGLRFSRRYNSDRSTRKSVLGNGWTHNYDIRVDTHSDADIGLGMRRPVDAAPILVSSFVSLKLMDNPDMKDWIVGAFVNKWAVDQLFENAATVSINHKALTYSKLPDGSFNPPPGVTTALSNEDGLFHLKERFGTRMDFDGDDRVSSWQDVDGNSIEFTYNGDELSMVEDFFDRMLTFGYSGDLLDSVTDSEDRTVSFDYDGDDNLTTYVDSENKAWSYGYDDGMRLSTLTTPEGLVTARNSYDSLGRVDTQTVPRHEQPDAVYSFYFPGFRNVEEDPEGNRKTYRTDEKGRTTCIEDPLGNKTTTRYDGQNHVVATTDPRGNTTGHTYDGNNNLIKTTDPLGHATNYAYDQSFRMTDSTDPLGHVAHFEYDANHHPTGTVSYPDPGTEITTSATFYPNGLIDTATDGRGVTTKTTYDPYGNPSETKTGNAPPIRYEYDSIGRLKSLTDQEGATTSFEYDTRGLITTLTDPLGKTTLFTYYNDGKLETVNDRNGDIARYTYTPSGKVDRIEYITGSQEQTSVSFTYDILDNLVAISDGLGTTIYAYDSAGRLPSSTDPHGFTIGYRYDECGNVTRLTYPDDSHVWYTYDKLNRVKTVTVEWQNKMIVAYYHYDEAGRVTGLDHFNGTYVSYGYDNADRLTDVQNRTAYANPISTYHFALDGNGNRTRITGFEPITPVHPGTTTEYGYNPERNHLESAGNTAFTYDDEGQMETAGTHTYTFDALHRLTSVDGGTYTYSYDGKGNRLEAVRNNVVTRYVYDAAGNLLAEADADNNITRYYIYGAGLLAMATPEGKLYCYHFDATGNTVAMTEANQIMVNRYAYTPFGMVAAKDETVPQPFTYVGQYGVISDPSGFYYMRARYYNPETGRFISEDPAGFEGGQVNLYVYAGIILLCL